MQCRAPECADFGLQGRLDSPRDVSGTNVRDEDLHHDCVPNVPDAQERESLFPGTGHEITTGQVPVVSVPRAFVFTAVSVVSFASVRYRRSR